MSIINFIIGNILTQASITIALIALLGLTEKIFWTNYFRHI
ncbi:ascorbate-specific PTS system EIIC-type component UlaA [Sporomusaceae bacterium BoRhaA]|nr:ascorbate-specific PTS system EIIC-type component UlaA [Pelorhabdus rhamnosifermentans]